MLFASAVAILAATAAIALPVENDSILKARAVYARHYPQQGLSKRAAITDVDILNFALNLE